MNDRLREIRLLVTVAGRTDPRRCIGAMLEPLGALSAPLYGVLLGIFANGIVLQERPRLVFGAIGLLLMIGLQYLAEWIGTSVRVRLAEEVGFVFDQEVVRLGSELPGLEHHERSDLQDRLELLRQGQGAFGQSLTYLATTVSTVIGALGTAIVLIWLNPFVLLIVVFVLPSFATVSMQQRWEKDAEQRSAEPSRLSRHLRELCSDPRAGMELRVFGLRGEVLHRMNVAWRAARRPLHGAYAKSASIAAARAVLFGIGFVLAVGFVLWRASIGKAEPGDVVTAAIVCQQVQRQVIGPAYSIAGLGRVLRNAGRLLWLREYALTAGVVPGGASVPAKLTGSVRFEHVSFRYPGTERWILRDMSIVLPSGSTVALIGENGAGKSTIVKLLCRFYEPTEGRITVDGKDIRELDLAEWRSRVSAAFQDYVRPEFLAGQAIGLGDLERLNDQVAIGEAAGRGGADEVLRRLPAGAVQQLGSSWEGGVDLSGGQWQRVALSRAFMNQLPLMLFFDEPTASLDAVTEHALFEGYQVQARRLADAVGTITTLVTHRFSTALAADLILVLDNGRLAQSGNHASLMAETGLYRELYEMQARSFM